MKKEYVITTKITGSEETYKKVKAAIAEALEPFKCVNNEWIPKIGDIVKLKDSSNPIGLTITYVHPYTKQFRLKGYGLNMYSKEMVIQPQKSVNIFKNPPLYKVNDIVKWKTETNNSLFIVIEYNQRSDDNYLDLIVAESLITGDKLETFASHFEKLNYINLGNIFGALFGDRSI